MRATTQRRKPASAAVAAPVRHDYSALLTAVRESFRAATASGAQLFLTVAVLAGREAASACGYDLRKHAAEATLRVNGTDQYRIDRWD